MIALPLGENLDIAGIPLNEGQSFACLAETILMGLENLDISFSYGNINPQDVLSIGEIAKKHGFRVLNGE
jgi:predicted amino acid dehydrogenase